jgi:hypothetical protein
LVEKNIGEKYPNWVLLLFPSCSLNRNYNSQNILLFVMKNNLDTWKFVVQFFFSAVVLSLCVFKLSTTDGKDQSQALYWGGLTGILGYWLPSPTNKRDDDSQQLGVTVANLPASNTGKSGVSNSGGQIVAAQLTSNSENN